MMLGNIWSTFYIWNFILNFRNNFDFGFQKSTMHEVKIFSSKMQKFLASVSENRMFLKIEFLRLDDKKHVSHVRVFNQLKCGNVCFGQKEIQSYTFFGILLSKIDFGKSCLCFAFGKVFRKIHWCFWPLITQILL